MLLCSFHSFGLRRHTHGQAIFPSATTSSSPLVPTPMQDH